MPTRLVALFNLRQGTDAATYERWAQTVDLPTVRALPSIDGFEVFRVTGQLGTEAPPPYAYAEIIDVADMAQFGRDVATEAMQAVAAEFGRMADVLFLTTQNLEAGGA
jgi:hypothetical protein